jgi:hypothetical protein
MTNLELYREWEQQKLIKVYKWRRNTSGQKSVDACRQNNDALLSNGLNIVFMFFKYSGYIITEPLHSRAAINIRCQ